MLLEFSHENANKVLALFNEGNIAQLNVQSVVTDAGKRFVFNYITMDSLEPSRKSIAVRVLNHPNSYMTRMRVTELLNQFIENMATNTVVRFGLEFSVLERSVPVLNTQVQFAKPSNTVKDDDIQDCIKSLDNVVTKMGIGPIKIAGVFRREGTGKGKKNVPLTVSEIVDELKTILNEAF